MCIKAQVQCPLKFTTTVSGLYPAAEGMATIYIPHPQPMACLDYPELGTSGQLERTRDETPRPRSAGNSACALQWGEKKRRVRSIFLVPCQSFQMFIMPAAPSGCQILFALNSCARIAFNFAAQYVE